MSFVPLAKILISNISEKYLRFSSLLPTMLKNASAGISTSKVKIFSYLL